MPYQKCPHRPWLFSFGGLYLRRAYHLSSSSGFACSRVIAFWVGSFTAEDLPSKSASHAKTPTGRPRGVGRSPIEAVTVLHLMQGEKCPSYTGGVFLFSCAFCGKGAEPYFLLSEVVPKSMLPEAKRFFCIT